MADKVRTLEEAAALVPSGAAISIGGFTSQRHPTALLRALVRRGVKDLVIYCHSAGSDVDLLIGAGCVRRVEAAYLADGVFSPIAPNWRRFVQEGRIEFEDYTNAAMMARFSAGAMGLPFFPVRSMLGTDLLAREGLDPEVRRTDPRAAPSNQGLVRIEGQEFLDVQQALAARTVIVTCEEIVEDEELRREPERNRIPPFAVHAVVHVPFGAHPHNVHNYYDYDPRHLHLYAEAARSDETFAAYLERFVYGPRTHGEYLEAVGGREHLETLRARSGLGYNPELRRTGV